MPIETRGGHKFASSFAAAKRRLMARAKHPENIRDPDAYTAGSLDKIAGPPWRKEAQEKRESNLMTAARKRVVKRMARWRNQGT